MHESLPVLKHYETFLVETVPEPELIFIILSHFYVLIGQENPSEGHLGFYFCFSYLSIAMFLLFSVNDYLVVSSVLM